MAFKVLFLTVAFNGSGAGHLKRTVIFAREFLRQGHRVEVCVLSDNSHSVETSLAHDLDYRILNLLKPNIAQTLNDRDVHDIVIVDLHNRRLYELIDETKFFLTLRRLAKKLVVLDGVPENLIIDQGVLFFIDTLIYPYCGSPCVSLKKVARHILAGEQYVIVDPVFASLNKYLHVSSLDSRILVTCGGADPLSFSLELAKCLLASPSKLDFDLIVGPLFSDWLITQLEELNERFPERFRLIKYSDSLHSVVANYQLCICMSGLTKYELATAGIPMLLVHLDQEHARANYDFDLLQCSIDCGVGVDPTRIVGQLDRVLNHPEVLTNLSRLGPLIFDGNGVSRCVSEIVRET